MGLSPYTSGWPFHTRHRSSILEIGPHREIVPIDVERDLNILRMQIRTGRIVKAPDFATGQDQQTNVVRITGPAFQPVPEVNRAEFVFVGSFQSISPIATRET